MLAFNFTPFPELKTARLFLRRITEEDAEVVFSLRSNPDVMQYVPRPLAKTIQDAHNHISEINSKIDSNVGINWAITLKGNPAMIGIIGHYRLEPQNYRAEIGYMMLPEFHGKGYVSEAIQKITTFGFEEMNLHSIEAIIDPDNFASARVLEKNQYIKEAHLKENQFYEGRFLDTVIYSLLRKNYKKNSNE